MDHPRSPEKREHPTTTGNAASMALLQLIPQPPEDPASTTQRTFQSLLPLPAWWPVCLMNAFFSGESLLYKATGKTAGCSPGMRGDPGSRPRAFGAPWRLPAPCALGGSRSAISFRAASPHKEIVQAAFSLKPQLQECVSVKKANRSNQGGARHGGHIHCRLAMARLDH